MKDCLTLCKKYMQYTFSVYFLVICGAAAKSIPSEGRSPANFVPDDDLIVVPIIIEKNMYEKFNERHEDRFRGARKTLQFWVSQEAYAEAYGLENTGFVRLPTEEQKEQFLRKHYLRFLSKDIERSTNEGLRNTVEEWTADDEINAVEEFEKHEKVLIYADGKTVNKELKTKSVKVGKSKVKFGFQPRLELGMVKFTMRSNYFNARAWVGINGNQELKLERKFRSTGTKVFMFYYIDNTSLLAAVDQKLSRFWKIRLTHEKDAESFGQVSEVGKVENNTLQLRFGMRF